MENSANPIDPRKGLDLSSRVLLRLRKDGVDRQVLNLLRTACDQALAVEGIGLSQVEKNRLILEMAHSIVSAP